MQSSRTTGSLAALVAVLAIAAPSAAKDEDPMKAGLAAEKAGRWQEAIDAFKRAISSKPTPQAEYHLAVAEEKLGQYVEALADFEAAEKDATAQKAHDVRSGAEKHASELRKKVAKITIDVDAKPGLVVTLDGKQVDDGSIGRPIDVNPGSHTVTAAYGDGETVRRTITLADGATDSIALEPKTAKRKKQHHDSDADADVAVASGGSSHTAAWVSIGIGVAGVAAGSYFALQAKHQRDELHDYCPTNQCGPEAQATLDTGKRNANVATAAFAVGGVGLALGAVLLLNDSGGDAKPSTGARVHPYVGLGRAGMIGNF
jgi:tetratricopeptide (TPR) repeat protein